MKKSTVINVASYLIVALLCCLIPILIGSFGALVTKGFEWTYNLLT